MAKKKAQPSHGRANRPIHYTKADKQIILAFLDRFAGWQARALRRVAEMAQFPKGEYLIRQLDYLTWSNATIKFMRAILLRSRVADGPGQQEVQDPKEPRYAQPA